MIGHSFIYMVHYTGIVFKVAEENIEVQISGATISRVLSLGSYLSRRIVANTLKRSAFALKRCKSYYHTLLAADRVYLAAHVTTGTGELLPHPFTLTCQKGLTSMIMLQRYRCESDSFLAGGLLSVALALGLLRPSVRWSPLLRAARTFLSQHICCQQLPVAPENAL